MGLRCLTVLALLAAACGQPCECLPSLELALVDEGGGAVAPGSGELAWGSERYAFDCSSAGDWVRCSGNRISVVLPEEVKRIQLSVSQAGGEKSFSGELAMTYADTDRAVCGNMCRGAARNVTMK